MTTVADLVEDTKRHLYGTSRLALNVLDTTIGELPTSVTLTYDVQGIQQGSIISIDDEIMYVFNVDSTTKTATVHRGFMGTVPAAHLGGALVEVNPRFPRQFIKEALKQEINSYAPRLFRVTAHNVPASGITTSFDMPVSDYLHVVDIYGERSGYTGRSRLLHYNDIRDADPVDFPSGSSLHILEPVSSTTILRVRVARTFDTSIFNDATEVEGTIGLEDYMIDIPPIGAAWRLLSSRETPRTNMAAQPEPRRAEEVPPGHISTVANTLRDIRNHRISEAQFMLRERYPYRNM